MKRMANLLAGIFGMMCLLMPHNLAAQKATTSYAVSQQDARLHVGMEYELGDNNILGVFTQDYRITVQNRTNDKLHVYIEYYAETVCGKRRTSQFAPLGDGYIMQPGESVNPTWNSAFGYQRFTQDECPKNTWKQVGVDKNGDKTYSIISSLGYRIVKIINLSEQERKEAEAKKKIEAEEKKQNGPDTNRQEEGEENQQVEKGNATNDDFFGDGSSSKKSSHSTSNSVSSSKDLYPRDENFVADSKFKNKLSGVKEGEYFTDGAGGYYKKELGGARKVDKMVYEREAANRIYEKMERQEAERQQRDAEFQQNWDNVSTSFYVMSAAKEGMRDASDLGSGFQNIEELNAAFNQKMRQVSAMGSQVQAAATQGAQAYANIIGTGSSGYDYSGAVGALGSIAAGISANRAENRAREELKEQRAAEEARIKKMQLDALVAVRTEIGKVFIEGGMPLSAHKITAPILYVFAYNSNKADWNKNQNVAMSISNVIPIYRYSDGTYPYTSNVKRTFENEGLSNPILMGYFTNKSEAENYRNSLLEVAPNAKFTVKNVEVKVKEQKPNTTTNTSETDFWGTKTDTKKQNNIQNTETDFWGTPVKDKKAEPKKESKKMKLIFGVDNRMNDQCCDLKTVRV